MAFVRLVAVPFGWGEGKLVFGCNCASSRLLERCWGMQVLADRWRAADGNQDIEIVGGGWQQEPRKVLIFIQQKQIKCWAPRAVQLVNAMMWSCGEPRLND
jgi:hypothetical protein